MSVAADDARVLPYVRMLFPCDEAIFNLADEKWLIKNPICVVELPPEAAFPFDCILLPIYVKLTHGIGQFDLAVEMRRTSLDGGEQVIWRSEVITMNFDGEALGEHSCVFDLEMVPFDHPGVYEFRMLANYAELPGVSAELQVLDRRARL